MGRLTMPRPSTTLVLAGMFDFEMAQDVRVAQEAIAKAQCKRPWRA